MFKDFFYKIRIFRYSRPFSGWWHNLYYYWYTRNTGKLLFFSILGVIVSAFSFLFYTLLSESNDSQNLTCLALNVYYEARGEPKAGQVAVAEVTMNRVASRRYPNTVCKVVYQKNWDRRRRRYVGMFSWTELDETPGLKTKTWQRAWEAAETVYYKRYTPRLSGALFYHAKYIRPSWAKNKKIVARIGKHIFYK